MTDVMNPNPGPFAPTVCCCDVGKETLLVLGD